jgi:hypothetical protein
MVVPRLPYDNKMTMVSSNVTPPSDVPSSPPLASIFNNTFRRRHQTIDEQIAAAPTTQIRSLQIEDLPRLKVHEGGYKANEYVLESWLHNRRPRTSWINRYGHLLVQIRGSSLGETFWMCVNCDKKRAVKVFRFSATSSAMRHLEHHLFKQSPSLFFGRIIESLHNPLWLGTVILAKVRTVDPIYITACELTSKLPFKVQAKPR